MKDAYFLFLELRTTSELLKKTAKMAAHRNNVEFKEYLRLCCDPSINFYIKKIPKYYIDNSGKHDKLKSLSWAYFQLKVLTSRGKTGNAAKEHLINILTNLSNENQMLIKNIISKDAKCGVGIALINKCWPNLIQLRPYQRFQKESDHAWFEIKWPAISTCKEDGEFIDHEIYGSKREYAQITRGNKKLNFGTFHDSLFEKLYDIGDIVIQTEALVWDDTKNAYMPRERGNGLINSDLNDLIIEKIHFKVINVVIKSNFDEGIEETKYIDRLKFVEMICEIIDSVYFKTVEYKIVKDREEALEVHEYRRSIGKEGSVLYSFDAPWKNTNSGVKGTMKQKQRESCDMIISDWKSYKPSANEGDWAKDDERWSWIGSLKFESSDGKVSVWCGSLKEKYRKMDPNELIGKIGIVNANDVLISKQSNNSVDTKYTLFLAAVETKGDFIRTDKHEADSFEDICIILKARRFIGKAKKISKNLSKKRTINKKVNIVNTDATELEW